MRTLFFNDTAGDVYKVSASEGAKTIVECAINSGLTQTDESNCTDSKLYEQFCFTPSPDNPEDGIYLRELWTCIIKNFNDELNNFAQCLSGSCPANESNQILGYIAMALLGICIIACAVAGYFAYRKWKRKDYIELLDKSQHSENSPDFHTFC